ncbi:MAG: hypothetical protein AAGB12_14700 [Pseudomonadota bacterium]
MNETISTFLFTNNGSSNITLIIEPWAEEFKMEPNDSVEIVGKGGNPHAQFEVEYLSDGLVVHGWEGSVVTVFKDGMELEPSLQT